MVMLGRAENTFTFLCAVGLVVGRTVAERCFRFIQDPGGNERDVRMSYGSGDARGVVVTEWAVCCSGPPL